MKNFVISKAVKQKLLDKHQVEVREVQQCFDNKCGTYLEDTREDHKSDPPTLWFVAPTNGERLLKVIFIFRDGNIILKSAYDADEKSIRIYEKCGK